MEMVRAQRELDFIKKEELRLQEKVSQQMEGRGGGGSYLGSKKKIPSQMLK